MSAAIPAGWRRTALHFSECHVLMNWRKIFKPSAKLSIFTLVIGGAVFGAVAFYAG
ncbi:hypothetical protein G3I74_00005, partial [Wenzhouxiangella sp. C33]|nr:hypothetical protein [Wenzhouxiangella limi]